MNSYKKYFHKEMHYYSFFLLPIILLTITSDIIFSYSKHPDSVNIIKISTALINIILIILHQTKKINGVCAAIIFSYIFTFNVYIQGFISDTEIKQAVISGFSNIGICYFLLIITVLQAEHIHTIILTLINISCQLTIYLSARSQLFMEISNIFIIIFTILFVYILIKKIDEVVEKKEEEHKQLLYYEKKFSELKSKEEESRVSFLSSIAKNNRYFLNNMVRALSLIAKKSNQTEKNALVALQINACKKQLYLFNKNNFLKQISNVDSKFITRIRNKYDTLSGIEIEICALLRNHLSTKEIASHLHKSEETIKWYRKKIRKKLEIPSDKNLHEFCSKI